MSLTGEGNHGRSLTFDPVAAIEVWLASWKLVLIGGLLFGISSVVASFFVTPVYRASVLVVPAAKDGVGQLSSLQSEFGGIAQLAGINLGGADNRVEALATLGSGAFTRGFISSHELMPILFASDWNAQTRSWRNGAKAPTLNEGAKKFDKEVRKISEDRKSGLVTVSVDWTDRELVAAWGNNMIRDLNEYLRRDAIATAQETIDYLESEVERTTNVELRSALYRAIEAQIHRKALATVQDDFAYRVIDPAVPPDVDRPIYPRRSVFGVIGFVAGTTVVMGWVLWRHRRRVLSAGLA